MITERTQLNGCYKSQFLSSLYKSKESYLRMVKSQEKFSFTSPFLFSFFDIIPQIRVFFLFTLRRVGRTIREDCNGVSRLHNQALFTAPGSDSTWAHVCITKSCSLHFKILTKTGCRCWTTCYIWPMAPLHTSLLNLVLPAGLQLDGAEWQLRSSVEEWGKTCKSCNLSQSIGTIVKCRPCQKQTTFRMQS